ncbi:uncharacterized protein LOC143619778 [Bidens hawaiensis]|uniref:uncharacterized protein LOC143619778 n=1 Tax=Bidens hawaiensis TaxID=980011 RepID=UPI00404B208B
MPSVTRLPFHLPGQEHVVYGANDDLDNVLDKVESVSSSMFTSWMKCNQNHANVCKLTYVEFPTEFVWHALPRRWEERKSGFSIGRIHAVSLAAGDAYFLRILLNRVKDPKSFEEILTVNGRLQPSFGDACYTIGLLEDDQEYIEAIEEASHSSLGYALRTLFATMLVIANEDQIKQLTLFEIEKILLRNYSSLRKYKITPFPDAEYISIASNSLIHEELSYDQNLLKKNVFDRIMMAVQQNKGGVFFVYGYGGISKMYLWKTLSTAIRSKGKIVLTVASSGIASLLLTGGHTTHSRYSEGNVGGPNDGVATIDIVDNLLIKDFVDPISKPFDFVYHDILQNHENQYYFQDRTILAPTNEIADEINDSLLKVFSGDKVEYLSSDTICSSEYINGMVDVALYSPELLNGLRISALPNHKLVLKVGVPVMLLRNLNQKEAYVMHMRRTRSLGPLEFIVSDEPERDFRERRRELREITCALRESKVHVSDSTLDMADAIPPRRTVHSRANEGVTGRRSTIARPAMLDANNWQIPTNVMNSITNSSPFHGLEDEDALCHLNKFTRICDTFHIANATRASIYLHLFPFSLEGRASSWLENLPPGSITT